MQERERTIISSLAAFLLLLWLGFVFHVDSLFAGSLPGSIVGLLALLFLLEPAFYSIVKRIPAVKAVVTKHVDMRTLLTWHFYCGIIAGILIVVHSGHRFSSPTGILLMALVLLIILSGFIGRYLMAAISTEIKEKKVLLDKASAEYKSVSEDLRLHPELSARVGSYSGFFLRLLAPLLLKKPAIAGDAIGPEWRAVHLGEAVADLEYAVETHELFKAWFARWLRVHIVLSALLYLLVIFHIGSEIRLGLRWLG